ncbi:hypothetical protein [Thermogutta sp.]|uniref:hypothetical protein n=1 Tax=Thermogutta sp. TaxID=1962930 RepID=UPI00321FEE80
MLLTGRLEPKLGWAFFGVAALGVFFALVFFASLGWEAERGRRALVRELHWLADDYGVWIGERRAVVAEIRTLGVGLIRDFAIRRNAEGTEVHVVPTTAGFRGMVLAATGKRLIVDEEGPWVRDMRGRTITRILGSPLRLCTFLRKSRTLDDDWLAFMTAGDAFLAEDKGQSYEDGVYCGWADPTVAVFSVFAFRPFRTSGFSEMVIESFYAVSYGERRIMDFGGVKGESFGYCDGSVIFGAWGDASNDDALELTWVDAKKAGEGALRLQKVVEVRDWVLRRPVELVDLDPTCRRLLVAKPASEDPRAVWFVVSVPSGRATAVWRGAGYGLFLHRSWIENSSWTE